MENPLYRKLMNYALWLLSRRSYTVQQLREKCQQRCLKLKVVDNAPEIESVIQRLLDLKYLNDLSYCERWVEERSRMKPRGRYLLTQELRKKGIDQVTLDTYWNSDRGRAFDERLLAERLVEQRLPRLQKRVSSPYDVRQKLYTFLASRGFSPGVLREIIDKVYDPY